MFNRPDRPLVVKCSFDAWNRKITFSSARNCTYELLRRKVEQCYSLSSPSFAIAYKDDDGEITTICTDSDLTEAICYFQAGDDAPLSSAASILSGRSFGSRRVTLRVQITVEYDGPSLSDTSSLISLDEYRGRNGSQQSISFPPPSVDLDDDSVTVSSRDNSAASASPPRPAVGSRTQGQTASAGSGSGSLGRSERFTLVSNNSSIEGGGSFAIVNGSNQAIDPFSDHEAVTGASEDPSAVFERLKLQEELQDDRSSLDYTSLAKDDRGAAWLKDQNERTIRSMLGALPEPSVSDSVSDAPQREEDFVGDLALERDPRGRYYYTYTSAGSSASQIQEFSHDDSSSAPSRPSFDGARPRPTSMHLSWLASQQIRSQDACQVKSSLSVPSLHTHHSDPLPLRDMHIQTQDNYSHSNVDKELRQFLPLTAPPQESLTDCSECGALLDAFRYVCSTCGEKYPIRREPSLKGKSRELEPSGFTYPPQLVLDHPLSSLPAASASSQTLIGSSESLSSRYKPLPSVPSSPNIAVPGMPSSSGYELCSGCLESAGVHHAIEAGLASGTSAIPPPTSAEDASRRRRAAPKKGQFRHAFLEKIWWHNSWEDVEQDDAQISKCSTCQAVTSSKRYKCASCPNINLCRACYSQVHELHPSHAFLNVPDKRVRSLSDPDFISSPPSGSNEEQSLQHLGVKCAHCLLDIVGARFHCAICDSVDICANCESAGLPGNLDSADGGHTSSHILIKIPYPLETTELESASRRAINLWTGRDAASVGLSVLRSKPSSVSSYARTVVGTGSRRPQTPPNDHHLSCSSCIQPIVGVRYQCANCPSSPRAYNLCETCERRSYLVHDSAHVFFKLPRPVHRQIQAPYPMAPPLYRVPVGPLVFNPADPTAYLADVRHQSSLCDLCLDIIVGAWFRCAYCARDLCDGCEEVDTHNDTHVFLVFKSPVDMDKLKTFANLESLDQSGPPVIPYPIYR